MLVNEEKVSTNSICRTEITVVRREFAKDQFFFFFFFTLRREKKEEKRQKVNESNVCRCLWIPSLF